EAPPLSGRTSDAAARLAPWVERLVRREAHERYATAQEAATALRDAVSGSHARIAVGRAAERVLVSPKLVGRAPILGELRGVLAGARSGRPLLALIEGDAGLGKSRLLEEVARSAQRDDFLVLAGGAFA